MEDKITKVLREFCGDDLAATLTTRTPRLIEYLIDLEEKDTFLTNMCGVPADVKVKKVPGGERAFSIHREDGEQIGEATLPPLVVMNYLCDRVATLQRENAEISNRRNDAVRIIEEKREGLQELKARIAKYADETPHAEVKDTLAAILAQS